MPPSPSPPPVPPLADRFESLVRGVHGTPFDTLGVHPAGPGEGGGWVVRAFRPGARAMAVRVQGEEAPVAADRRHAGGVFVGRFPDRRAPFPYRLVVTGEDGRETVEEDPYRFPPLLTEIEIARLARGEDLAVHERLGAHPAVVDGVSGTRFAVWAPQALRASVIGDFDGWDGRRHPMRPRGSSGIWELFLPGVGPGALYKYELLTRLAGRCAVKADPCGFAMEVRPNTASVVVGDAPFAWTDDRWMRERGRRQAPDRPIAIYEVHLGSWKTRDGKWLSYRELADELVPWAVERGFTHLELLPVTEHPYDGSWGYQTVGYFAPTSRHGSPDDFRAFVDAAHRAGLGVILDWVPGHFPRDGHGLGYFDGTHLYEHADPRRGLHRDWGTFVFDFGRPPVTAFLLSSARWWLESFHLDGLRVDAVASMLYLDYSRQAGEWLPNERGGRENLDAIAFLRRLNALVHGEFPGVLTFAEESTAWPGVTAPIESGGLGFDCKWNMGWMNDVLSYMRLDPLARSSHHDLLTLSLTYAFSERFLLPLSHDEVVHGKASLLAKMPGDAPQAFANLRALYGWMWAHPGKKLLFMGGEIGPWTEWNHATGLPWDLLEHAPHAGLLAWVDALNRLLAAEPALYRRDDSWEGFEWIECEDAQRSVVSCVRRTGDPADDVLFVANFTPVRWTGYRLGVPRGGRWRVRLDSDAATFGGAGSLGASTFAADATAASGREQSILLDLPPMAALFLKREEASGA